MKLKSNKSNNDKYWTNTTISIDPQEHRHYHNTAWWSENKYENLPNFVGGLYVENGILKLLKSNNQTIELGRASDINADKNLFESVLDKFFA
jgi:hypothetical protein